MSRSSAILMVEDSTEFAVRLDQWYTGVVGIA